MKNIYESAETFEANATVEAGLYMMRKANEQFNKNQDLYSDKQKTEHFKFMLTCIADIIEAKKILEADYSKDAEMHDAIMEKLKNHL